MCDLNWNGYFKDVPDRSNCNTIMAMEETMTGKLMYVHISQLCWNLKIWSHMVTDFGQKFCDSPSLHGHYVWLVQRTNLPITSHNAFVNEGMHSTVRCLWCFTFVGRKTVTVRHANRYTTRQELTGWYRHEVSMVAAQWRDFRRCHRRRFVFRLVTAISTVISI